MKVFDKRDMASSWCSSVHDTLSLTVLSLTIPSAACVYVRKKAKGKEEKGRSEQRGHIYDRAMCRQS